MILGELAQGAVVTLLDTTRCSGTMRNEQLPAGTRVKVAWQHQERATFVDVLDGDRKGELLPCPTESPAAFVHDGAAAVTGAMQDATREQQLGPGPLTATGPRTRQARMTDDERAGEAIQGGAGTAPETAQAPAHAEVDAAKLELQRPAGARSPDPGSGKRAASPQERRARARKPRG